MPSHAQSSRGLIVARSAIAVIIFGTGLLIGAVAVRPAFAAEPEAGLYAELPGEEFAAADPRLPNTVLRARADDMILKLSNPREGVVKGKGTRKALLVDYEIVRTGKFGGGEIVVHSADGQRSQVRINFDERDHGTVELVVGNTFFRMKTPGQLPKDAEFYVVRTDDRFGPKSPTFKVSNSIVLGTMTVLTKARNWTPEEIAAYQKGPPTYVHPNQHPDVGEDTEFAGATSGGRTLRYVDPSAVLIGLEFGLGEWAGEKCLGGLTPIFARDQETIIPNSKRELAKPGYAVAGAEVYSNKYVDGVKLIYAKLKADGTLNLSDSYTGSLLGHPGPNTKVLAKDGRKVLGIYLRQGAILDGLALVAEKK